MVVDVAIQAGDSVRTERIDMTSPSAAATFKVAQEPAQLVLDPDVRILAATQIVRR